MSGMHHGIAVALASLHAQEIKAYAFGPKKVLPLTISGGKMPLWKSFTHVRAFVHSASVRRRVEVRVSLVGRSDAYHQELRVVSVSLRALWSINLTTSCWLGHHAVALSPLRHSMAP